jgi:triosephosphate isomerase
VIIAGNFKSFKTRKGTAEYLTELNSRVADSDQEVIVFPPATALDSYDGKVKVGIQNGYPAENGAFTGEITLDQIREFDIDTILLGHSERREVLGETNELVKEKFNFYRKEEFTTVLCIGETLQLRERGFDEVKSFLLSQLDGIDLSYEKLVIAYEPIWAIGTGVTPTNDQIEETLQSISEVSKRPVLYGGSVKLNNIEEILSLKSCSGVLVGGASLDSETFGEMVKTADRVSN